MTEKTAKKYTVADLFAAASGLVKDEMAGLKKKPLNAEESEKAEALARMISKLVLKEMKIA